MFKINEVVVHKCDICKITEIKKDFMLGQDYYTLIPIDDSSLVIHTPVSDNRGLLRKVISKDDAEAIIKRMSEIETIAPSDERTLENEYIKLINSGKHEDLVRIIKTAYLRNAEKENCGKKPGEKDKRYFKRAEKLFYTELSIALKMTYQETKDYVVKQVAKSAK